MALQGMLSDGQTRKLAAGLGLALIGFGALPTIAPRPFARFFGFDQPDPATASLMRSLGVRDAVTGIGLWSAASHGGKYLPWLLSRTLVDGGDTLAVGLAVAQGKRNPRFIALGSLALGATAAEAALYGIARAGRQKA